MTKYQRVVAATALLVALPSFSYAATLVEYVMLITGYFHL
jgi:hypothetical protein